MSRTVALALALVLSAGWFVAAGCGDDEKSGRGELRAARTTFSEKGYDLGG